MIKRLRAGVYSGEKPELVEYGVSAQENERFGLPCGGKLILLLQQLNSGDAGWLTELLSTLGRRACTERQVDLSSGETTLHPVAHFTSLEFNQNKLRQCFGPRTRMLLVSAGQLAHCLSELALAMDYEVIVTDPRHEALRQWEGPELELIQGMPDDVIREKAIDRHSIVITLTHDPRIDDMALMEALETDAWYVGALGSALTTQKRLLRLQQLGLSQARIDQLHAPVGLDIGSKTPIEIAVAIMAELTMLQRKRAAEW